jgi:hypothetical protein
MHVAPISRLGSRLERHGLDIRPGHDELVADAPHGEDSHALNLSAFA